MKTVPLRTQSILKTLLWPSITLSDFIYVVMYEVDTLEISCPVSTLQHKLTYYHLCIALTLPVKKLFCKLPLTIQQPLDGELQWSGWYGLMCCKWVFVSSKAQVEDGRVILSPTLRTDKLWMIWEKLCLPYHIPPGRLPFHYLSCSYPSYTSIKDTIIICIVWAPLLQSIFSFLLLLNSQLNRVSGSEEEVREAEEAEEAKKSFA